LIFWFWLYEIPSRHRRFSPVELAYIHIDDEPGTNDAGADKSKVRWIKLLGYRQTWCFFFGKFLTDGAWYFYLFWLPDYLKKQFGMGKSEIMLPTFIVFGTAIVGSVFGGSLPLMLIKRGMSVYHARMTAMFFIAVCPLAVLWTQYFAHQAWSANIFTTVSDMFPKKAVASVTGIGAMAGGLGGVIIQMLSGRLNDLFHKNPQTAYLIMFTICGFCYLIAWTVMKILVPRHQPITDL
jgi:ACS family hexuronate transporter-like MFS transporter